MNHYTFAFVAATALVTGGCPSFVKATGPAYTSASAPDGKAVVYFYRPARKIMADYPLFMSLPESANNCFRLESGGYTAFVTDPGNVTVAGVMTKYQTMSFQLKAGDVHYVEVDIVDDEAVLKEVSAEAARAKISATRGIATCEPSRVRKS